MTNMGQEILAAFSAEKSVKNPVYRANDSIITFMVKKAETANRTNSCDDPLVLPGSTAVVARYPSLLILAVI